MAVPFFAVSMFFKESTILLPVAVAAARTIGANKAATAEGSLPKRLLTGLKRITDPVLIGLALVSALFLVSFAVSNIFEVRGALAADAPYALTTGPAVWLNLLTYLGWTVNFFLATVRTSSDVVEPAMFVVGAVAGVAWLAGLAFPGLRRRGWLAAGIAYAVFLLPVLPLRNHTYHYYLYAPLFGAAWCVAALFDWGMARAKVARAAWSVAVVLAILLTVNGTLLVNKIEHAPYVFSDLRADPTVDRSIIADNVRKGLTAAMLPDSVHLYFWSPAAKDRQRASGLDTSRVSYLELNVESALQGGLAVRVLFPTVREVSFVRSFREIDNSDRYAVYRLDGTLRVGTYEEIRRALEAMQQR